MLNQIRLASRPSKVNVQESGNQHGNQKRSYVVCEFEKEKSKK
jgi:hypothetical protein